jgi:hypothetical protein
VVAFSTGRSGTMRAAVGDHLVVMNLHLGEAVREGEILEVHGTDGAPPYRVRWSDGEHESLVYPGADAKVRPRDHENA